MERGGGNTRALGRRSLSVGILCFGADKRQYLFRQHLCKSFNLSAANKVALSVAATRRRLGDGFRRLSRRLTESPEAERRRMCTAATRYR